MEVLMPDGKGGTEFSKNRTLHIILDEKDKIYWYNGLANPLKPPLPEIHEADFSKEGIRKILLHRNKDLFTKVELLNQDITKGKIVMPADTVKKRVREMRSKDIVGPLVLVKATDKAKYGNVVDIIDEMAIANIARYAIVDMNKVEQKMLADYKTAHEITNKLSTSFYK
jgi:biopolymer transport protein ExbD